MSKINRNNQAQEIIWNFLLDHAGEKFYLTQIARQTNLSDSTVHQILESQVERNLIKKEKLGNLSFYSLDKSHPAIKLKKQLRTIFLIQPLINQLKEWSQKIILFGSAALGEDTSSSDIDLLIISKEKDKIYEIFSKAKIKNKVKLIVKNFLEWSKIKQKDKFFYEQINKGKVLWDSHE